jgi:hypothetical protein
LYSPPPHGGGMEGVGAWGRDMTTRFYIYNKTLYGGGPLKCRHHPET